MTAPQDVRDLLQHVHRQEGVDDKQQQLDALFARYKKALHEGEGTQMTLETQLFTAAEAAALAQARLFWLKAAVARWLDTEGDRP